MKKYLLKKWVWEAVEGFPEQPLKDRERNVLLNEDGDPRYNEPTAKEHSRRTKVNRIAVSEICDAVDDEMLQEIENLDDAKEVWEKLRNIQWRRQSKFLGGGAVRRVAYLCPSGCLPMLLHVLNQAFQERYVGFTFRKLHIA